MYKLEFFVPEDYKEKVKTAIFNAGGGRIGNYDYCSWETLGKGQFKPNKNSNPFIGEEGKITKIQEFKVELICDDDKIENVIKALKKMHPYETPAYQYWKIRID